VKKYLSILLAMLCVFGFSASAFAAHVVSDVPTGPTGVVAAGETQITLSGEVRVIYDWRHVGFNSNDSQSETSFANERMRLGLDVKLTPNTSGMIQLSSEADPAQADPDNMPSGGTVAAGGALFSPSRATGIFSSGLNAGNELKGGVSIRQLWILHTGTGLLGIPAGLKIGHMPLILGSGLFFDHSYFGDDALVGFIAPAKEWELDAVAIDFSEGYYAAGAAAGVTKSNKDHAYALIVNYKPSKTTGISFDATYVDDQNIGDTAGVAGIYPDIHLWNFGIRGNTEWEGLRMKLDGEFQTGTLAATGAPNTDFDGFAIQAGLGYTLDPVKLDLEFGYGSGDDGKTANKVHTFVTSQGPESTFGDPYRGQGLQGGIQGPYVYNYRTVNATGQAFGGLANTWYVRLGGNADVAQDTNLDIALFYLQAVEAITTSNVGLYDGLGAAFSAANVAHAGYPNSRDIGFEADARLTYKIDKGLITWLEGGYLWAGDFWKAVATVTPGQSPSNCYTMRTGIQLNF